MKLSGSRFGCSSSTTGPWTIAKSYGNSCTSTFVESGREHQIATIDDEPHRRHMRVATRRSGGKVAGKGTGGEKLDRFRPGHRCHTASVAHAAPVPPQSADP
jgi:hypothetical protein